MGGGSESDDETVGGTAPRTACAPGETEGMGTAFVGGLVPDACGTK